MGFISDYALSSSGQALVGATVQAFPSSTFGTPPTPSTSVPSNPTASTTSSNASGTMGPGGFLMNVPDGSYWVVVQYGGVNAWKEYSTQATVGLPGATQPTRYVGGTAGGPPTTGSFLQGDFVIDNTGHVFVCTAAGTPGTWNASYHYPYKVSVYVGTNYNAATGTTIAVLDTTTRTDGNYNTGNWTYTVPVAGDYLVSGRLQAFTGYDWFAVLRKNGSDARWGSRMAAGSSYNASVLPACVIPCVAGDTLALYHFNGAAGVATVTAGAAVSYMDIQYLGLS